MNTRKILISGVLISGISSTAYGYIDPGVGNMLVQGILAGSAGALFVFRMFWGRIKARLRPDHKLKQQTETK
jgi:hypothetical protein